MTYAHGYPVRLAGGRLALDFINTADWSGDGQIVVEKIETEDDLTTWLTALGLARAEPPENLRDLHVFRRKLRADMIAGKPTSSFETIALAGLIKLDKPPADQPLLALVAASALSILVDVRERARIKMCPGVDCGWLFIDETRNGRRKWCLMETCGNRAKAARHYQKITKSEA